MQRLEGLDGTVLGGAQLPGELNAGSLPAFLVFREQVVVAVRGRATAGDHRDHREQQQKRRAEQRHNISGIFRARVFAESFQKHATIAAPTFYFCVKRGDLRRKATPTADEERGTKHRGGRHATNAVAGTLVVGDGARPR